MKLKIVIFHGFISYLWAYFVRMPDLPTRGHGCHGTATPGLRPPPHGRTGVILAGVRLLPPGIEGPPEMQRRDEEGPPLGTDGREAPLGSHA